MNKLAVIAALATTTFLTGCNVTVETNTEQYDPEIIATGGSDWVFNPKTGEYERKKPAFSTTIKSRTYELPEVLK
ncbi:hypothetical protein [Pseudoalteromonas tunicata]|uniref:hypothetical protein n=1 Tax=Pseudoalteromonas tunicata TaxID=314281 RepID=UPI00273E0F38|nr:hypothetical protein [Pseudoalteromonas tunicata]MDP4985343.1 hypothetical protein [Pseudoalteromonas tunicata]